MTGAETREHSSVQGNPPPVPVVPRLISPPGTFSGAARVNEVMADFDNFVAAHIDDLLRTAYLIVWDEGEAEDLVQECLLKVARRWPRVRRMEQPQAYARRILVNLALDGARRRVRRRRELEPGTPPILSAIDPLQALETRTELLQALGQLHERQRAVLVLRYFNDLTEAQVADVLGCSPGTVKSSASRGLARLREALQPVPLQPRSTET
jgi:RNA polymerase sigma-70 factor (sigma-E family)